MHSWIFRQYLNCIQNYNCNKHTPLVSVFICVFIFHWLCVLPPVFARKLDDSVICIVYFYRIYEWYRWTMTNPPFEWIKRKTKRFFRKHPRKIIYVKKWTWGQNRIAMKLIFTEKTKKKIQIDWTRALSQNFCSKESICILKTKYSFCLNEN